MRNEGNGKANSVNSSIEFVIAPVNARTWIVVHSRGVLPGAVLRTKQAALNYVLAIARAAAFSNVSIAIGNSTRTPAGSRH